MHVNVVMAPLPVLKINFPVPVGQGCHEFAEQARYVSKEPRQICSSSESGSSPGLALTPASSVLPPEAAAAAAASKISTLTTTGEINYGAAGCPLS